MHQSVIKIMNEASRTIGDELKFTTIPNDNKNRRDHDKDHENSDTWTMNLILLKRSNITTKIQRSNQKWDSNDTIRYS